MREQLAGLLGWNGGCEFLFTAHVLQIDLCQGIRVHTSYCRNFCPPLSPLHILSISPSSL